MSRLARVTLVLLVACAGCQPLCGVVFDVVLPEGADRSSSLIVEATATRDDGREVEPDRLNVAHTERGFVVEVGYFEVGVDIEARVWVDVDGDGERGPGDLEGQLPETALDGGGCDSMTTVGQAVVLAPIPPAS